MRRKRCRSISATHWLWFRTDTSPWKQPNTPFGMEPFHDWRAVFWTEWRNSSNLSNKLSVYWLRTQTQNHLGSTKNSNYLGQWKSSLSCWNHPFKNFLLSEECVGRTFKDNWPTKHNDSLIRVEINWDSTSCASEWRMGCDSLCLEWRSDRGFFANRR